MITVFRLALFFFVFSIEVRVRAESVNLRDAKAPLANPADCIKETKSVCAVETGEDEKFTLKLENGTVILSSETTLIRTAPNELRLVRGEVWIRSEKAPIVVRTEYGEAQSAKEYWVERSPDQIRISATGGDVSFTARASSETLLIPQGLENTLGRIGKDGVASIGIPIPIEPSSHLARWARLYPGTKADFEKDVAAFRVNWTKAKPQASEIHQALFDRKVASIESEAKAKAEARRKADERNRILREQFRAKFLSGE